MAAILLALLTPAWALVEMMYRYPETKKKRKAERERLKSTVSREEVRLGVGRGAYRPSS